MFVKVCGIKTFDQIDVAAGLGYDMIGVICHENSCRYVDSTNAAKLADFARKKGLLSTSVGLTFDEVKSYADNFDYIQIYEEKTANNYPTILAVSEEPQNIKSYKYILYDISKGSGEFVTFKDWVYKYKDSIILAGGLKPGNVRDVIKKYRPFGVDVSSGVESEKGIKDYTKMREFIQNVRSLDI